MHALALHEQIHVPHPGSEAAPQAEDFGEEPLLRALMDVGLATPFRLDSDMQTRYEAWTARSRDTLQAHGDVILSRVLQGEAVSGQEPAPWSPASLRRWTRFQRSQVVDRSGRHSARIPGAKGVDYGEFGDSIIRAVAPRRSELQALLADEEPEFVIAYLARGVRYQARAAAARRPYLPHTLRRDFIVQVQAEEFQETRAGAVVLRDAIRGIPEALRSASLHGAKKIDLLELRTPLLGGRVWKLEDCARKSNSDFARLVAEELAKRHEGYAPLRKVVRGIRTEERAIEVEAELAEVAEECRRRLAGDARSLNHAERALRDATGAVPGIGKLVEIIIVGKNVKRDVYYSGTDLQQLVFREIWGGLNEP